MKDHSFFKGIEWNLVEKFMKEPEIQFLQPNDLEIYKEDIGKIPKKL